MRELLGQGISKEVPLFLGKTAPFNGAVLSIGERSDVPFIEKQINRHHLSTGFVPRSGLRDYCDRGHCLVIKHGEDLGYVLLSGGTRVPLRLQQVCVREDLWRMGLGGATVGWLLSRVKPVNGILMTCRTAEDVVGMQQVALASGGVRGRLARPKPGYKGRLVWPWYWLI